MEGWRDGILTVGKRLWKGVRRIPPRRVWAATMALLLWLEMGGMAGSALPEAEESGFGEVHWYNGE